MGKLSLYHVPLSETEDKMLKFEYNLDNKFFERISDDDSIEIRKGDVKVELTVKHKAREFELNFDIVGTVKVPCDRCLDELAIEVQTKDRIIVKFGDKYTEESDEIVVIPEEDKGINVAWFIFEFIVLSLPAKKVHQPGLCNRSMSNKYNKHKSNASDDDEDDDSASSSESGEEPLDDPRWDALKDIGSNADED